MPLLRTYARGAELPFVRLPIDEEVAPKTYEPLDLSSGYTFTIELVNTITGVDTEPSAVVTGHDGYMQVAWAVDDLDIAAGDYELRVRARETATSKDRDWSPGGWPIVRITE